MAQNMVSFVYVDGFNERGLTEAAGFTVANLKSKFSLPENLSPLVNGVSVSNAYVIKEEDEVSFVQPQQAKA